LTTKIKKIKLKKRRLYRGKGDTLYIYITSSAIKKLARAGWFKRFGSEEELEGLYEVKIVLAEQEQEKLRKLAEWLGTFSILGNKGYVYGNLIIPAPVARTIKSKYDLDEIDCEVAFDLTNTIIYVVIRSPAPGRGGD